MGQKTATDAVWHISTMHRDAVDAFTSFQHILKCVYLASVCSLCSPVCVQHLTFVFTHNHRACLCPQSASVTSKLDTRVGMRLREKVIRSQREQVVTAYYSLSHPPLSPAESPPFCSGRGQGSDWGNGSSPRAADIPAFLCGLNRSQHGRSLEINGAQCYLNLR